ncbi:twin-arginine translocase subunit TatB [Paracoccus sediminis]|uniref:Sec-independent protein translocase protein TatB n=1 Tax=Paracoccus sediminis TaxID=1214787 RepID=A0A238UWM2_9RHOB|nr:Sec-independent protein translocase protein TatB [Paracoccus sediminis]TBN52686.1 twin-arginine translocase subunit TatB [Paracoccus sediminis]SNR26660.1 sec-independent protein translocase protein TatB [Paracoccus sediminis]
MLDVGWSELLLIGVVALIVVGPKDLPHLFHSLGRFTAKARSMAREFTSAMEDAARNSGIDDAAKTLRDVQSLTSKKALGLDALDRAADRFEKWDPKLPDGRARIQPDPASPAGPVATPEAAPVLVAEPAQAAAPSADPAEPVQPRARRLRAVRRSDMKDD